MQYPKHVCVMRKTPAAVAVPLVRTSLVAHYAALLMHVPWYDEWRDLLNVERNTPLTPSMIEQQMLHYNNVILRNSTLSNESAKRAVDFMIKHVQEKRIQNPAAAGVGPSGPSDGSAAATADTPHAVRGAMHAWTPDEIAAHRRGAKPSIDPAQQSPADASVPRIIHAPTTLETLKDVPRAMMVMTALRKYAALRLKADQLARRANTYIKDYDGLLNNGTEKSKQHADAMPPILRHVYQPAGFRIALVGGAGTGKTHVAKTVTAAIDAEYVATSEALLHGPTRGRVIKVAPIGAAAYNVGGTKVHTGIGLSLGLPVSKAAWEDGTGAPAALNILEKRERYRGVWALIMDEAFTCSAALFHAADMACRMIFGNVPRPGETGATIDSTGAGKRDGRKRKGKTDSTDSMSTFHPFGTTGVLRAPNLPEYTTARNVDGTADYPFGGLCVLFAGDPAQAPPVKATPMSSMLTSKEVADVNDDVKFDGTYPVPGLLHRFASYFTPHELHICFRQKQDPEYLKILDDFRHARNHDVIEECIKWLTMDSSPWDQDATAIANRERHQRDPRWATATYVVYRNKDAEHFNREELGKTYDAYRSMTDAHGDFLPPIPVITIVASDTVPPKHNKQCEAGTLIENGELAACSNEVGGIMHRLTICCGVKVMLRHNIDPNSGLVNRAVSTVARIEWSDPAEEQLFDNHGDVFTPNEPLVVHMLEEDTTATVSAALAADLDTYMERCKELREEGRKHRTAADKKRQHLNVRPYPPAHAVARRTRVLCDLTMHRWTSRSTLCTD
eukprot:tig00020531_g10040.t1